MRTSVVLDGRTRYRYEIDELRHCAKNKHGLSNSALDTANALESEADKLEAALNAPEPLVAGDIVEWVGPHSPHRPGTRMVVLMGGDAERVLRRFYESAVYGPQLCLICLTDGRATYIEYQHQLRRVGHITDRWPAGTELGQGSQQR